MASKRLLVVVFIFDLIAFGLAVVAARLRNKATVTKDAVEENYYCVYDSDIGTGLGSVSFSLICASQICIMVASKCFCCKKSLRPGCSCSKGWAVVLFITCWFTFGIAVLCLLAGSARTNYYSDRNNRTIVFRDKPSSCEYKRKILSGGGATFVVFTGIVTELYYVCHSKAKDRV